MTRRSWQRTSRRCRTPRVTERAPPSGRLKDEAAARSAAPILDPAGRRSFGLGMGLRTGVGRPWIRRARQTAPLPGAGAPWERLGEGGAGVGLALALARESARRVQGRG